MTEFYQSDAAQEVSAPVRRALAFQYILEHKKICINEGELIVGERGPAPLATPTYPEICIHCCKTWKSSICAQKCRLQWTTKRAQCMKRALLLIGKAKVCATGFSPCRQPGLTPTKPEFLLNFRNSARRDIRCWARKRFKGLLDMKADIQCSLESLDFLNDPEAYDKREELKAMNIAADALDRLCQRHADNWTNSMPMNRIPLAGKSLNRWQRSADTCWPMRRVLFGKLYNITGLCT